MAFLYEADRGLTNTKEPNPHLGPGVYDIAVTQQIKHSCAPFMSTNQRVQPQKKVTQPGPGSYEISRNLGESGVQAYMNKSTIIVKVQGNGSSAFKSIAERFNLKPNNGPGPGTYNCEIQTTTKPPYDAKNPLIEEVRSHNNQRKINSIPEPRGQIGNQYPDIEALAQHQNQIRTQVRGNRNVGPTTYNITEAKVDKGISWDRDRRPRFNEKKAQSIGPGHYECESKTRKKNASPAFLSESVRSYFDQLVYNTNSELKAELRKRTNYKDNSAPGPGTYANNRSSIRLQNKPREYQFFGSSLERFNYVQSDSVGPGSYNVNYSFDGHNRKKNFVNATFMSTSAKEEAIKEDLQPGPGTYELDAVSSLQRQVSKKYSLGYKGSFGHTGRRFEEPKPFSRAGPGSYDAQVGASKGMQSCFKSGVKRDGKNVPAIGQYKLDQNDIAYKANKQNKFLRNLERIDVAKPGFDSGQPRFKEAPEIEQPPTVTRERSHTTDNPNCRLIMAPFKSQAPRFAYVSKQPTPGVGKYQVDKNNWKVVSFNTHYNKLLEEDKP